MKNRPKPWTEEEIKIMLDMRKQGCSYAKIADRVGRSAEGCMSRMQKIKNDEKRKDDTVEIAAEIQSLINMLKTDKEIREELGLSIGELQGLKSLHGLRRTYSQISAIMKRNNRKGVSVTESKTICWTCKKVGISCKKPVEGWTAKKVPYKSASGEDLPSWLVSKCPNYDPEPYAHKMRWRDV
jgi:hypothetical protein